MGLILEQGIFGTEPQPKQQREHLILILIQTSIPTKFLKL
jgi:hypothetical protein